MSPRRKRRKASDVIVIQAAIPVDNMVYSKYRLVEHIHTPCDLQAARQDLFLTNIYYMSSSRLQECMLV